MDSVTLFEPEKNQSKGAQATQSGGPPGLPMLPPGADSEGECFAPLVQKWSQNLSRVTGNRGPREKSLAAPFQTEGRGAKHSPSLNHVIHSKMKFLQIFLDTYHDN